MKKILLFCCLLFSVAAFSKSDNRENILQNVYRELLNEEGVLKDSVKYTGSDFSKAGGGFLWQQGGGYGWTTGCRLTLKNRQPDFVKKVREKFLLLDKRQYVLLKDNYAATRFGKTLYAYYYSENNKTLYFLKASSPKDICVPIIWTRATCVDAMPEPSNAEMRQLVLARLWAGVIRNFAFMDRVKLNWDSLYVATMPLIAKAKNDNECAWIIQRMIARLGDGHTHLYGYDINRIPIKTKLIDGKVYVDKILSSGLIKNGLKRGAELVSVNGMSPIEYGRKYVEPYISSCTPQWTAHCVYENRGLFQSEYDDALTLQFMVNGKSLTIHNARQYEEDLTYDSPIMSFSMKKNAIGYLKINTFMGNEFRSDFDKIYPQLLKTSALIIDLRDNEGGISGSGDYILRHLTTDSIKCASWSTPVYAPAFASWGRKPEIYTSDVEYMQPVKNKTLYDKAPVVLLVNSATFSAAEDFCGVFKGMKRGVIMGTPTGGSIGNGVRIRLMGNIEANICSKHDIAPDGTEFVGIGFRPSVEVEETYKSYFEDKEDVGISKALEYLEALKQ